MVFSSSRLDLSPSLSFISLSLSLSRPMEFQLPSITQGDLPVQKTNHQVSRRRVAADEVRSSVVALTQTTYKVELFPVSTSRLTVALILLPFCTPSQTLPVPRGLVYQSNEQTAKDFHPIHTRGRKGGRKECATSATSAPRQPPTDRPAELSRSFIA